MCVTCAKCVSRVPHVCHMGVPVQEAHPEVQAVASGAIASDYQRLRVENVSTLGVVSGALGCFRVL
jgi:diphthamide synthase (EF-2-diphthine--ammonia ligase)